MPVNTTIFDQICVPVVLMQELLGVMRESNCVVASFAGHVSHTWLGSAGHISHTRLGSVLLGADFGPVWSNLA